MPLYVGCGPRDLLDALERDGDRRGAGGSPRERNPAFDLASLEFPGDSLAERGFLPAQLIGKPDGEVEVAMIDAAELDRQGDAR